MAKQRGYERQTVESIEYQGHGIIKPEGRVVFVEGVLPGEVIDVAITRRRRDYAYGKVTAWHTTSPERQEPFCSHFADCGGCTWQYLPYAAQLRYKEQFVAEVLRRIGHITEPAPLPIIGCESDTYYRNKLDFSFAPVRWITQGEVDKGTEITDRRALGFHVKGRFNRVLDIEHCYLQPDPSNAIRTAARQIAFERNLTFHDPAEHVGLLRSIIVRTSTLGGVMAILVVGEDRPEVAVDFLTELCARVPSITSAYYIINTTRNDDVGPHPAHLVHGDAVIVERCGHLKVAIHPKSFYQTNSLQAERLYGVVRDWLSATGTETLLDLYCGIGSIGLFVADLVQKVVGVESVEPAVERAVENAELNGISNASFSAGDVRELLAEAGSSSHPEIVVLDPPRAGVHPKVIEDLIALAPRQIIYVSCKPSTQARDLAALAEHYEITRMQPVDMFPQTFHIENVVDLRRRDRPA